MASRKIDCKNGDDAYLAAAKAQAKSITDEAQVWAAIQVALMAAQRSSSGAISDMQEALAKRRMVMAEEALAHAKETWAKEKAFVEETMAAPVNAPVYTNAVGNAVDAAEAYALLDLDSHLGRFGLQVDSCDDKRTRRGFATARTDLVSHAMRAAEARALALNDRRYSRQVAVLGLGRAVLQNARAMGTLADGASSIRGSLINTVNSGLALWGYSANRWRHGQNYHTGQNGAPMVVPEGSSAIRTNLPQGGVTVNIVPEVLGSTFLRTSGVAEGE